MMIRVCWSSDHERYTEKLSLTFEEQITQHKKKNGNNLQIREDEGTRRLIS